MAKKAVTSRLDAVRAIGAALPGVDTSLAACAGEVSSRAHRKPAVPRRGGDADIVVALEQRDKPAHHQQPSATPIAT